MTIHNYEYYHDSYIVSISVHKINIMIEDKGTCSHQVSFMSDYLYILISWNFCHIFYKNFYEITFWIIQQSTILFMNSLKLSWYSEYYHDNR